MAVSFPSFKLLMCDTHYAFSIGLSDVMYLHAKPHVRSDVMPFRDVTLLQQLLY